VGLHYQAAVGTLVVAVGTVAGTPVVVAAAAVAVGTHQPMPVVGKPRSMQVVGTHQPMPAVGTARMQIVERWWW
jgi:hypothetical protein